ncbi:hypothetical protein L6164_011036 [Bauhinia variegata]|uniref:Uncharacterized protein n=1 Tax=Bauhinia variegata TaxID=167791 RepID=A0ACB9P4L9_BAUVA|nr:hypothetical protein L6164_011036 [Bauhinia variegata]
MAEAVESCCENENSQTSDCVSDCVFVWDENTQLYFHSSSGFYHDPNAGWYYSSRDGLYYKFEDGNYVLLEADEGEIYPCKKSTPGISTENSPCQQIDCNNDKNNSSLLESKSEAFQLMRIKTDEAALDLIDGTSSSTCENPPPPSSEWLEETLIDLYLSGYKKSSVCATDDAMTMPLEIDDGDNSKLIADDTYELEEGEWIPDDDNGVTDTISIIDEGNLSDEDKWRAQYGQVTESGKEMVSEIRVVDLWDWEMVRGCTKDGKYKVARLVGRLVKQSAKLHPSMPSKGGKLRSAPICEAHLDLVRVKTGQVYKLRNPSAKYIASLSIYDSANPTKDWGFPQLSINSDTAHLSKSCESTASVAVGIPEEKESSKLASQLSASKKRKPIQYRDRAAERRVLHGGFGVGPGQKNPVGGDNDTLSSPVASCPQDAAAEALEISFGAGSFARKILKSMGWKEGEGLGSSTKGLVEPIQAVGNIGNAGLGWSRGKGKD